MGCTRGRAPDRDTGPNRGRSTRLDSTAGGLVLVRYLHTVPLSLGATDWLQPVPGGAALGAWDNFVAAVDCSTSLAVSIAGSCRVFSCTY